MRDECRESDGLGEPRAEAEGELAVARLHLDSGDARHAAVHVAQALHYDPSFADCYAMIDDLAVLAEDTDELVEWFRVGEPIYIGAAAAVAALRARAGQYGGALDLLGVITASDPERPWCAAPWFGPRLAEYVPGRALAVAVSKFNTMLGDPAPAPTAAVLAPWLELSRAVAARSQTTAQPLAILSGLARRIGAPDEAIAWCERAEALEARGLAEGENRVGAVMLGFALRSANRPADAVAAWRRALTADPGNIDLHIDLAETCMQQEDHAQAVEWAERAAKRDPGHLKPKAVRLAALYALSDCTDNGTLAALQRLARENPDHSYPKRLVQEARQSRPWLGGVPWPTEAAAGLMDQWLQNKLPSQAPYPEASRAAVTGIEAPTLMAALRAYFPQLKLEVLHVMEPDPRAAVPGGGAFGEPIWRYQGTDVTAAVGAPGRDSPALEALRRVAEAGNWNDPLSAHDRAAGLAGLTEAELLGLIAHVPLSSDESWAARWSRGPAYWTRLAQAWACLGVLYLEPDEPWQGSKRRNLLLRLLFGPEDWSVDAAAFALYTSALLNPEQRPDVAAAIGARYLHVSVALGSRPTEIHKPLAHLVLACPEMDPRLIGYAREMLAWQRASGHADGAPMPKRRKELKDRGVTDWADRLMAGVVGGEAPTTLPAPVPNTPASGRVRRFWPRRER